ncbi:nucleoside ABC transporter membrane protein [Litoreibacter halocynthiae]|uniref:Nucleoside ABC transporter membrane protein n=1 Tax=Litoreibacter halocynthiae TaxID=1242689 RepID=A0A4R7LRG1_9RHOB|nr:ABC transporter permease [Litoreibacter halocynthiae]TDT76820.1 nucleoside ABC transporter membrane protein [Litoreibacter halocynthiae]
MEQLPKWADLIVVPLVGLILAFSLSMLMVFATGHDPMDALSLMVKGALGSTYGWGYTLYYATNFIFTGLAVAVAFHASLFNIGGEGQAALGGLGVALVCLFIPWPHWTIALVAATAAAGLFGALWALIPAYLQAKRGSHIVITTIMFNFIAASLLNYVLVNKLRPKGSMDPATAKFPEPAHLPSLGDMLNAVGIPFAKGTPANVTLVVALLACVFVYYLIWRTRLGYQLRAFGESQPAAVYAGINPVKITIITMMISGALAGLMAINNVMGEAERLILGSVEGAGFIGIAVALMGRSHPLGILFAALLFGALYQGGAELGLWTSIPRELVIVIQALVILFTGALDNMVRSIVAKVLVRPKRAEA